MATVDLPPADEFQRLIHVVDSVCYAREPPTVRWVPALQNRDVKHLKLLDGISLLMVQRRQGDMAAASYRIKPDGVDLFLAKNAPLDTAELNYVHEILAKIRDMGATPTARNDVASGILKRALLFCHDKYARRLEGVVDELERRGWTTEKLLRAADGQEDLWPGQWNNMTTLGDRLVEHHIIRRPLDKADGRRVGRLLANFTTEDIVGDETRKYDMCRIAFVLGRFTSISLNTVVSPATSHAIIKTYANGLKLTALTPM
jgi:hypothetical protein